MDTGLKKHLWKEAVVGGVCNALANGWIAWLLMRGGPDLVWGGSHSFATDILATAFLLPLIVALIVIPLQRRQLARGRLQPIDPACLGVLGGVVARFPRGLFASALLFGLVGLASFAPLALLGIYAAGISAFSPQDFAVFKGVWAGLMAGVLVVGIVLVGLRGDAPARDVLPAD